VPEADLAIMRRLDRLHLEHPYPSPAAGEDGLRNRPSIKDESGKLV
jgi:hypothetical protein